MFRIHRKTESFSFVFAMRKAIIVGQMRMEIVGMFKCCLMADKFGLLPVMESFKIVELTALLVHGVMQLALTSQERKEL